MSSSTSKSSIELVPVADIIAVRHRVLRQGRPIETAHFDEDAISGSFHLALRIDGAVVGSVSLHPKASSHHPDTGHPWQLRGMAVDETVRNGGLGAALVARALSELADRKATLVWCNSRVRAQSLYERAGFVAHGDLFEIKPVGLHRYLAQQL